MVSANYEAYKSVMRQAYRDGEITPEESAILETLRQSLNISSDEHSQCETEVQKEIDNGGGPVMNSDSSNPEPPMDAPGNPDDHNIIRPGMNPGEFPADNPGNPSPGDLGEMPMDNPGGIEVARPEEVVEEPKSLEDLLKEGKSSYHGNNFQSAIDYFDKALVLDPENSEALFFRKRSVSKLTEQGGTVAPSGGAAAASSGGGAVATGGAAPSPGGAPALAPEVVAGTIKGDPNCGSCNGAGTCRWCKATGGCYWCKGAGQCDKCKGTGVLKGQQCSACAGSGKCHSCKGSGHCYWCQGNGKCNKCSA
jgi:hypothetical protein